ncbi:hypothetical protein LWI29_036672 [Acer saccharum]|uniref:Uncharacterized protein n=1 Tax=Acer saccharum TaxID=4024 RepID=A0AA39SC00_ACESA|nr:hypothetical protein LWI29_036672 [Acer saccharum]
MTISSFPFSFFTAHPRGHAFQQVVCTFQLYESDYDYGSEYFNLIQPACSQLFLPCVLTALIMGSGACEDQSSKCKDSSPKFAEKLDGVSDKEPVELSTVADGNGMASLEPITPVPNREAADSQFDCKSPLSVPNRPAKHSCFDSKTSGKDDPVASIGDSSPKTPRDVVFDPFAPAPDHLAMAPLNKKYINQVRSSVARRLNFESSLLFEEHNKTCSDGMESISDEEIFESVYNNLLEAIVSKQTECFLEEIPNIEWDSDCCKTPPVTRLNGIAETCPGAPKKSSAVSRKIDLGLCRKLEY